MKKLLLMTAIFFACSLCVSAHPGSTDDYGGHVDWSTGEYHYHHGYSAHQHTNGVCPYEWEDNTDTSYNGNTSANYHSYNYTDRDKYVPDSHPTPAPTQTPNNNLLNDKMGINWASLEEILVLGALFSVIPFIIYLFAFSFFVKVPQSEHVFRLPVIFSFVGCSIAQYYKVNQLNDAYDFYFLTAWVLIALLLYEYFLYRKARRRYINIYAGKEILDIINTPPTAFIDSNGLPHQTIKDDDVFVIYLAPKHPRVYHRHKGCGKNLKKDNFINLKHYGKDITPCKKCCPLVPDTSWYNEYLKIKHIKEEYNID